MDLASPLKSDVFYPVIAVLVPGATAVAPFALIGLHLHPEAAVFVETHAPTATVVFLGVALAIGMILEDFGSALERHVWDPLVEADTGCSDGDWEAYLSSTVTNEPVAQRYLRTILTRAKFEASFGLALIVFWLGLLWWDVLDPIFTESGLILTSAGILALSSYLLWEAGRGARLLADLRHIILEGTVCPLVRAVENADRIRSFERTLRAFAVLSLVGGLAAFLLVMWRVTTLYQWAGLTSSALGLAFGGVMALSLRADRAGRRARLANRLTLACVLSAVLLSVRLLDRGPNPVGLVAVLYFLGWGVAFRCLGGRLVEDAGSTSK